MGGADVREYPTSHRSYKVKVFRWCRYLPIYTMPGPVAFWHVSEKTERVTPAMELCYVALTNLTKRHVLAGESRSVPMGNIRFEETQVSLREDAYETICILFIIF